MNRLARYLLCAITITTASLPAWPALSQINQTDQDPPRITKVLPSDGAVQFGSSIRIEVEDISRFYRNNQFNANEFLLYLNKIPMPGLLAYVDPIHDNTIVFNLKPDNGGLDSSKREALRQAWRDVLRSPKREIPLEVGLSYEDVPIRYAGNETDRQVRFKAYNGWTLSLGVVLLAGVLAALIYLARKSDLLRDGGPPQPPLGERRPYSLARTQMAFWTIVILGTFGFLYIVTANYQTLTEQSLILLGIAAATALASVTIDVTKSASINSDLDDIIPRKKKISQELVQIDDRISRLKSAINRDDGRTLTADEQRVVDERRQELGQQEIIKAEKSAELERLKHAEDAKESQLTKPVSEGFVRDILTDKDGVTLHRLQIILWTAALGALFVWEVWDHLAMPTFSMELLALMGISSGTYLGFKIPEKQS